MVLSSFRRLGLLTAFAVGLVMPAWVGAAPPVIGWDVLAGFDFEAPAYEEGQEDADIVAEARKQIPVDIAELDRREVVVTGFMLPVRLEEGKVVEFLLVSDPMVCCYGAVPKVNEWITVRLEQPIPPEMDVTLAFVGEMRVGPVLDSGYLTTIYEMESARKVER